MTAKTISSTPAEGKRGTMKEANLADGSFAEEDQLDAAARLDRIARVGHFG